MKIKIAMSAVAFGLLSSVNVFGADDLSAMFSEGKASGQIRMFYIDRQYQGGSGADTHRNAMAIGGHLKYELAAWKGLSAAAAFYTTNQIHMLDYDVQDPSLSGTGLQSYSILGEAYVNYDMSQLGTKTNAKLGYQRYDTPMMGSDDARMLPNTFEAYKFTNSDIENVSFQIAQVTAIAYGTFLNSYLPYAGTILPVTSGYTSQGDVVSGKYLNMGQAAVGKNTNGVTNAMVSFKNKNFNAKISNDYAWDLYNTLYAEAGASWNCLLNDNVHPFVSVQAIKQNSVGDNYMQYSTLGGDGKIDSLYWAAKVGAKYAGLTAYAAYSETTANDAGDAAYKNAIITEFGGMPAYTQGMVTRHQFLAGTKAWKVAADYDFKALGTDLSTAVFYASFDVDANSGYGIARTASESGFDIQYYPEDVKNLQLRLRGNFPRKFAEATAGNDTGWNEYRFIANYNF
jgi:imipenem/basic amino acid-specific outer membrane pore